MKYIINLLILTVIFINCRKEPNNYGIVKVPILNGRDSGSLKSKVNNKFTFGTVVELDQVSENKETIDGYNDYWYRDKKTKSWIFGAYILSDYKTEINYNYFYPEYYFCNIEIDGNINTFSAIIIGDYFVSPSDNYIFPDINTNDENYSITIGKVEILTDKIIFHNFITAFYNSNKSFIKSKTENIFSSPFLKKDNYFIGINHNTYNNYGKSAPIRTRRESIELCNKSKNLIFTAEDNTYWVFEIFYHLEKSNFENVMKKYPLLKNIHYYKYK